MHQSTNHTAKTQTLAPALSLSAIESSILPMMDRLVADDIPNIRFNVAKSYTILIDILKRLPAEGTLIDVENSQSPATPSPHGQDLIGKSIMPNLEKLQTDGDVDVRYFASTAAASAEGDVGGGGGGGDGDGPESMVTSP